MNDHNILQNIILADGKRSVIEGLFHSKGEPSSEARLNHKVDAAYLTPASDPHTHYSFYSYFNALSVSKWRRYCGIDNFGLHLSGHGPAYLMVYLKTLPGIVEVLFSAQVNLDQDFDSPEWDLRGKDGLLYFDVYLPEDSYVDVYLPEDSYVYNNSTDGVDRIKMQLSKGKGRSRLISGYFWTSRAPTRNINLLIVVTTFKREKYVSDLATMFHKKSLNAIAPNCTATLLFVDNGNTLKKEEVELSENIRVIRNPNTGGAGGFSRGMLESLADSKITHLLLMDDDVTVEAESIRRSVNVMRNSPDPLLCLGGAMLNAARPSIMYEQGATVRRLLAVANKHNIDLQELENIWRICEAEKSDYYGWWFFMMPKSVVNTIGLALPLFFRGDDMDYSMRLMKEGIKIAEINGACVWHEPFVYKENPAQAYYDVRNTLLMVMGRNPNKKNVASSRAVAKTFFKHFFHALRLHRYCRAERMIQAVDDFMRGPDYITSLDQDALNKKLMINPEEKIRDLSPEEFNVYQYDTTINMRIGIIKKFLSRITLWGLLVPSFLRQYHSEDDPDLSQVYQILPTLGAPNPHKAFRASTLVYIDRPTMKGFQVKIQTGRGLRLWFQGFGAAFRLWLSYKKMAKQYTNALPTITSTHAWQTYLHLEEG